MKNLLGDLWLNPTQAPDWSPILNQGNAKLHLYGKRLGRPGRKMGHFCVLDDTVESALEIADRLFARIQSQKAE